MLYNEKSRHLLTTNCMLNTAVIELNKIQFLQGSHKYVTINGITVIYSGCIYHEHVSYVTKIAFYCRISNSRWIYLLKLGILKSIKNFFHLIQVFTMYKPYCIKIFLRFEFCHYYSIADFKKISNNNKEIITMPVIDRIIDKYSCLENRDYIQSKKKHNNSSEIQNFMFYITISSLS